MDTCPVCGGELAYIGDLRNFAWYRCRNCGSDTPLDIDMTDDEENENGN